MVQDPYPVQFSVDYPDRPLNRLTTFFRIFTVIPIAIVLGTVSGGTWGSSEGRYYIVGAGGLLDIHARYTIENDAGALIQVDSKGLRQGPPDILARLAKGEDVDPSLYYFRTVMRFETAHPATDWLNRILALARGAREKNAVKLDVYEVL